MTREGWEGGRRFGDKERQQSNRSLKKMKGKQEKARITLTSIREAQTGVVEPAVSYKKTIVNKVMKQSGEEARQDEQEKESQMIHRLEAVLIDCV
jgi:hypothetical protein